MESYSKDIVVFLVQFHAYLSHVVNRLVILLHHSARVLLQNFDQFLLNTTVSRKRQDVSVSIAML